jgi:hypothetical protein
MEPMDERNRYCGHCRSAINVERPGFWEVAVNLVCGCLLLAALVFAGSCFESWIVQRSQKTLDHLIWREPLEDWNR